MDIADLVICILAQEVARLRTEVQRLQADAKLLMLLFEAMVGLM
jgi:hypothetical protein